MRRAMVFFSHALEEKQDRSRLRVDPPPLPLLLFAEDAVKTSLSRCEVQRREAAKRSGAGGPICSQATCSRAPGNTGSRGGRLLLQMWHCVTALMGAGCGIREG